MSTRHRKTMKINIFRKTETDYRTLICLKKTIIIEEIKINQRQNFVKISIRIPYIHYAVLKNLDCLYSRLRDFLFNEGIYKCDDPKFSIRNVPNRKYVIEVHDYNK